MYLRLDGSGVEPGSSRVGTVNCQFGAPGLYEKFKLTVQSGGVFTIESATFPNVFLRLNGSGLTATTSTGGGTATGEPGSSTLAEFAFDMADQNVDFVMQHQEQTMWCWSAATVSVSRFYDPASPWTQCSLANAEFNRKDACVPAGQESPANEGRWPDTALQRVGNFRERLNDSLTTVQLGAELAKSAPVVVNIAWRDQNGFIWGGHIVAVRGRSVRDGVEWVSVGDPWSGDLDMTYDNFRNRYQNSGLWNVSYKTKARG
ncbi:papain-like cysteine protease family protein [Actinosynnema sp. NPDC059335]|uniref:papain-like cysteine protease family protein n=1 Tax=Actinosynnema sp. NPDC059335 TaxID=3346804 RepID=UPI00366B683E